MAVTSQKSKRSPSLERKSFFFNPTRILLCFELKHFQTSWNHSSISGKWLPQPAIFCFLGKAVWVMFSAWGLMGVSWMACHRHTSWPLPNYFLNFSTFSHKTPGRVLGISSDGDDRMEPKVKTQKNPWTKTDRKLTPKKSHADFVARKSSQAKEIKSSLKQKGISVTVKPTDWIEVVEVLYTAGYQGTMQTIVWHVRCKATP